MTFDTEAGFGIDDLSGEEVPFEALFLDGGTRVVIEFTEGGSFDRNEALSFIFTIQNGSGTDLPLGLRFSSVPTPGSAVILVVAGVYVARRRR